MNDVGIEPHQIGRVRWTDLRHSGDTALLQFGADRHALEEGFKRHFLADLGEDMLVAAEGITDCAHTYLRSGAFTVLSTSRVSRPDGLRPPPAAAPKIRYRTATPALR